MGIEAKRVFGERTGASAVLVAARTGLATVAVSGDAVGEFGLAHRGPVRDVAVAEDRVALATPDDVLAGPVTALADTAAALEATAFGPARAVGYDRGTLVAAGEDRIARRAGDGWTRTADVAGVEAIDGGLVAAADGVFRVDGSHVGLAGARDVAAAGPYVATDDGLYHLANGWQRALAGSFRGVAAAGERAHAATADAVFRRAEGPGDWASAGTPAEGLVAVAEGPAATYVITDDGTLCVEAGAGWRTRALGLPSVAAVAAVAAPLFED